MSVLPKRNKSMKLQRTQVTVWPFVAGLLVLIVTIAAWARAQVGTNIGEDARKFDSSPGVPIHPDQRLELAMKIKQPFTVVAVGDLLEFQPFSKIDDPDIQYLVSIMRNADLTIGDFEDEIYDFDNFGHAGGNLGTKEVADDWANMGIKIDSRANNKDQTAPGIWEDFREIERVGILHVGAAHTLPEARMARYLELPKGLVGEIGIYAEGGESECCTGGQIVHVTSRQLDEVRAMKDSILARRGETEVPVDPPSPDPPNMVKVFGVTFVTGTETPNDAVRSPGRGRRPPSSLDGVNNSLGVTMFHGVTSEQMSQLRAIAEDSGTGSDLSAFGTQFRVMARPGEHSFDMNPQDLKEILTQIKTGKEASEFLSTNTHWHQGRFDFAHNSFDHFPPDFEIKFAHAAIDEGDDLFVAQGVHTIKGVEIYKGKPIFYGVSNYVFQSGLMPIGKGSLPGGTHGPGPQLVNGVQVGASGCGRRGYPKDVAVDAIIGEHEIQGFCQLLPNLEALLAWTHYENGKLTEVRIYPVDLGQTSRATWEVGTPKRPAPAVAKKILDEVIEYSKPFGTKIVVENGVGIIRIPPSEQQ